MPEAIRSLPKYASLGVTLLCDDLYERYRFMNDVPVRDGDDALRVNWCELVKAGRARWKIENEHNFGHGIRNLANTLLTMNLLAFLFHSILELYDRRDQVIRTALGRRNTLAVHAQGIENPRSIRLTRPFPEDSHNRFTHFQSCAFKVPSAYQILNRLIAELCHISSDSTAETSAWYPEGIHHHYPTITHLRYSGDTARENILPTSLNLASDAHFENTWSAER